MVDEADSDEQRWQRAVAGDAAAREQIAALADRYARATMRRRGVPAGELDDLAQEVAIGVERCRENGMQIRVFRRFVYFRTLAIVKEHRARAMRSRTEAADLTEAVASAAGPAERAATDELLRAVAACRDALPEALRVVLDLRHAQDCMLREIAERTRLSLGGVRERFRRAWQQVQRCLHGRGFDLGADGGTDGGDP